MENEYRVTGFATPAESYAEREIDWYRLLLPKPHAMYAMRVREEDDYHGIHRGDLLIIDTSRANHTNRLVVVSFEGAFRLGMITRAGDTALFRMGDQTVPLSQAPDFRVIGVVSRLIRFYNDRTR